MSLTDKYSVPIGRRLVGPGQGCFIVFEAGATHSGLESAQALARAAKAAGADAVKYQLLIDPTRLVADAEVLFTYGVLSGEDDRTVEQVTEPLLDILARRSMPREDWLSLGRYCRELDLETVFTAMFHEDVDLLADLGCSSVKIASADLDHWPLIEHAARSGLTIQLDTGSADLGEIDRAVDLVLSTGNRNLILHHCPTGYPARLDGINLRTVTSLRALYDFPIAFSDHSPGWVMDVAALALGVDLLEKTITLDRRTRGCEHIFSLEPDQAGAFVREMRELEIALGHGRHVITAAQRQDRKRARRSLYLATDVKAGDRLKAEDIDFRRPGYGLSPQRLNDLLGRTFGRDLPAGSRLGWEDFDSPD